MPSPRQALIHLKVPAGATLFVNDKQVDPAPTFLTPELEPEKDYNYEFPIATYGIPFLADVSASGLVSGSSNRIYFLAQPRTDTRQHEVIRKETETEVHTDHHTD